ncbi:MAG: S4 domain-containing protein [Haliangiales bacterium]
MTVNHDQQTAPPEATPAADPSPRPGSQPDAPATASPAPSATKELTNDQDGARVRIDKWLWAARFFKTRSIAATAISNGKVELNGERTKRSKQVRAGDVLRIRKGMYEHEVVIQALAERRGSATLAQTLYQETEDSVAAREELAERMRLERASAPTPIFKYGKGRPTKRDRRALQRLKEDPLDD